MALPVSQGGIDYHDGGFSSGVGGFPMIGDLAEQAVRLGSINAFDRRGTTIWMTDFENGLQGSTFGTDHANSEGIMSATRSYHGAYSIKLDPRGAAESYVEWSRVIHYLEGGRVGLEVSVSLDDSPDSVRIKLLYFDGTTQSRAELHYDHASGNWTVRTGIATWETILSGYKLQTGAAAWHPIKLIVDFDNGEYVRAQMSRRSVDISAYDLYTVGSGNLGQLSARVMAYGAVAAHAPVWADGIIVTQNEPPN